jgi:formylmethanofuran dehydrogenase subunit C
MKNLILNAIAVALLLPMVCFSQPSLGMASDFALFTSVGAVTNTGITHVTGNVGTNSGSNTGFGNVNGVMHEGDGVAAQCASDVLAAYNTLNATTPTFFVANLLGNGQIVTPGVYSISSATTLNLNLILNAQGNANAVFIFQIQGAFSSGADAQVVLQNGAKACNVYWKIEGLVSLASGTAMKGTIIANNGAINMNSGTTLEGRALTTNGAVTTDGLLVYTPIGCGSPVLNGPTAPNLNSAICYTLFSANGETTNAGVSTIKGDVGTNVGLTTGFDALNVNGLIHPIPDVSTAACAADLLNVYTYLNTLPADIELLYPAQFGNNLVLTPHTYLLNAATVFTDTLFLDAQGNADAVFVIKVYGALTTSTFSNVVLTNGAQAKNVYWKIDGAVEINENSIFKGNIICNNGAVALKTGVNLSGRAFTTAGSMLTNAITATMPLGCTNLGTTINENPNNAIAIYPNPFSSFLTIEINDISRINNATVVLYDTLGREILKSQITKQATTLETSQLVKGLYFYKVISNDTIIQSGKLIAQ